MARGARLDRGGIRAAVDGRPVHHPVCPACSPGHEHDDCATRLHGFATPLLIAAGLHSALDGWSVAAGNSMLPPAFTIGIAFHKLPEGIALGVMARASMERKITAIFGAPSPSR